MPKQFRPRARLVCARCHERKVRCDLEKNPNGKCGNCCREGCPCRRRFGSRIRSTSTEETANSGSYEVNTPNNLHQQTCEISPLEGQAYLSPQTTQSSQPESHNTAQNGYIGDESVLVFTPKNQVRLDNQVHSLSQNCIDVILDATKASQLPSEAFYNALVESYLEELFPLVPVVDEVDLKGPQPSLLLLQSVCFAGSTMRYPRHLPFQPTTNELYTKVKTLLYLNIDTNQFNTLKSLCLLSCWSASLPYEASLECPWQWVGMAIRLATQLGLHRESTYIDTANKGCRKRIWWYLFNNDTMQAACFGRLPMLQLDSFDVSLPQIDDFKTPDMKSHIFCNTTSLCMTVSTITALAARRQTIGLEDLMRPLCSLSQWITKLPESLVLYNSSNTRTPYNRWGSHRKSSQFFTTAVVASFYIIRLYEEVIYRDDVAHLNPIHCWFVLVSAIPQFCYLAKYPSQSKLCSDQLQILRQILLQLSEKYPSAKAVLEAIKRLEQNPMRISGLVHPNSVDGSCSNGRSSTQGEDPYLTTLRQLIPFPGSVCPPNLPDINASGGMVDENTSLVDFTISTTENINWNIEWSDLALDNLEFFGSELPSNTSMQI